MDAGDRREDRGEEGLANDGAGHPSGKHGMEDSVLSRLVQSLPCRLYPVLRDFRLQLRRR